MFYILENKPRGTAKDPMARPLMENLYNLKTKTKEGENWVHMNQIDFYRDKIENRNLI